MKNLLEQIINDRGQHAEKFKERIAFEGLFEGRDTKELVEEYRLARLIILMSIPSRAMSIASRFHPILFSQPRAAFALAKIKSLRVQLCIP